MSKPLRLQTIDAKGGVLYDLKGNICYAIGTTKPTDGTAGYAVNCPFYDNDTAGTANVYINEGTALSCDFNPITGVDLTEMIATATELNYLAAANSTLTTGAGVGITTGTGTVYKTSVIKLGTIIHTVIYIDLTGLASISTDGDIIGVNGGGAAHIGRITAAQNGTIESMKVFCTETPAGGLADIDVFRATVGTGVQDDAISGITGQATTGAVNITAINTFKCATACPAANDYLYLCAGASSGAGTYTAGKLEIHLIGY